MPRGRVRSLTFHQWLFGERYCSYLDSPNFTNPTVMLLGAEVASHEQRGDTCRECMLRSSLYTTQTVTARLQAALHSFQRGLSCELHPRDLAANFQDIGVVSCSGGSTDIPCGIILCLIQHVKAHGKQFFFQCLLFNWEAFEGKHLPLECSRVYFILPKKGHSNSSSGKAHHISHHPVHFQGPLQKWLVLGHLWNIIRKKNKEAFFSFRLR